MAIIATVPIAPGYPLFDEVISGGPVRASTWTAASDSLLNSLGSTNIFVPWHSPRVEIAVGASKTLRYRYTPNGRATQIRWVYQLIYVTTNSLPFFGEQIVAISPKSSSIQTVAFTYTNSDSQTVRIVGLIGYEDTNSAIEDIDKGVKPATYQIREPITGTANESIGGLFEGATANFRRYYLNHSDTDDTSTNWNSAVTTPPVQFIKNGIILTRRQLPTSTVGPTQWHVRAAVSNNAAGAGIKFSVSRAYGGTTVANHMVLTNADFPAVNTFYNFTMPRTFTWSKTGTATATLTRTNHNFLTLDHIYIHTSDNETQLPPGFYQVTVTGANTLTITTPVAGTASGSCTNDLGFDCEDYNDNTGMPSATPMFYDVFFAPLNANKIYISNVACEEVL